MHKPGCSLLLLSVIFNPFFILANKENEHAENVTSTEKIKIESRQSKVMDIAFYLTDVCGPRLTNSPGFKQAATWAKNKLTEFGLENARLEPWGEFGKGWQQEKSYVAMTSPYYNPIIAIPKAWTGSTPGNGETEGEVILIDAKDSASFASKYAGRLKGKIVMLLVNDTIHPAFTPDASRYSKEELENLANAVPINPGVNKRDPDQLRRINSLLQARMLNNMIHGENPALILDYSRGSDGTLVVHRGGSQVVGTKEVPATVVISSEEYLRIERLILAGIPVKIAAEVRTRTLQDDLQGYNVIAEIPGTDPLLKGEIIIAGAHLDSWHGSTGATDNAAGCAIMMEAVRMIKSAGLNPRRTIRIILWSGEEQGLLGSKAWVKNNLADLAGMNIKPGYETISAYFNLDNGGGKIRGIYCQGNLGVMPIFQEWLNKIGDAAATTVTINNTGSTDHLSFDAVGIPGFQFIQDKLEYDTRTHHTSMDSFDHLVPQDMIQASTIAANFIINTAQRENKLPRKGNQKSKQSE